MSLRMKIEIIILCIVTIAALSFYIYNRAQIDAVKKELQTTEKKLSESIQTIDNLNEAIASLQTELNYRKQEIAFKDAELESMAKLQEETASINNQTLKLEYSIQEAISNDTLLDNWYKQEIPTSLTNLINDPLLGLYAK